jgi:VIT1/CCC1 family predicted Fe2+/Mn2+ transporter
MVEGISRVTIDIYDYKSAVVGTYIKSITFTDTGSQAVVPIFPDLLIEKGLPILLVATPLALISFLIFFFYRRRRHHDGG